MYGKVILTFALLALVSVQLGESLECYTCHDVSTCKKPSTVKCDQVAANKTLDFLNHYYYGVKSLNTSEFTCFVGIATYGNGDIMAVQGCIMKDAIECSYSLRDQTQITRSCTISYIDTSNKSNSVGVISSSIVAVISMLIFAKVLDM